MTDCIEDILGINIIQEHFKTFYFQEVKQLNNINRFFFF